MSEILDPGGGRWSVEKDECGGWHLITVDPTKRYFPTRITPAEDTLDIEWGEMRTIPAEIEPTKHEFRSREE